MFPIASILICHNILSSTPETNTIASLHSDFPLLWIIDSAPFVLAGISYVVGTRIGNANKMFLDEINAINEKLVEQNKSLQSLNDDKVVLLKEIHHRVKNNLQVVTSLLSLQSSFIEDKEVKAVFDYSQYRINSMSLIHEMLYQTEDIAKIRYDHYLEKLATGLADAMKGDGNNVTFNFDIPEKGLDIDTVIPLGLLVTEAITNSLKYGIDGDSIGEIALKLIPGNKLNHELHIEDNGKGYSDDINFETSSSLGLMLMHKLSLQLKGSIEKVPVEKGTKYILTFQELG